MTLPEPSVNAVLIAGVIVLIISRIRQRMV